MNKVDCIEDFFASIRAYYLFQIGLVQNKEEYMSFILDKRCLNGAKVSFISNIMLGIKENLVDTKGAMDYRSKTFLKSLEDSVSYVATKVESGYKIGNYVFPDAATLVAIIRNKLAHGKYKIDFEHNRVILEHKGVDIVINIEKLVGFMIMAFRNSIRDIKRTEYKRTSVYLYKKSEKLKNSRIKDRCEIKKIIKGLNCVKFKIESLDGSFILPNYIEYFENFFKEFKLRPYNKKVMNYYNKLELFFRENNYKISMEYVKMDDEEQIDKIEDFIYREVLFNDSFNYEQQLQLIGAEVERFVDSDINSFDSIMASVHNLILLDAISKTKSVDREILSSYIEDKLGVRVKFSYDEYGIILISMFNSLFLYPFDDVFETSGEYKIDRESGFDFSKLDLSMIKPNIINIDESPLNNSLERCNSLLRKQTEISQKLSIQQSNLMKVKGNTVAEGKINANINDLNNSLSLLITEYMKADSEYNAIKNDYVSNRVYFENRAVIEGIRNAIAHGNYEFKINGDFYDTEIIFKDIYEGKTTFELRISFRDFEYMIDLNYDVVLDYVRNKVNGYCKIK